MEEVSMLRKLKWRFPIVVVLVVILAMLWIFRSRLPHTVPEPTQLFCRPTNGPITSRFGPRTLEDENGQPFADYHYGIDITGNHDPVYAIADGIVIDIGEKHVTHPVIIRHNATINFQYVWSSYLHMENILVEQGTRVSAGQLIGYQGAAGAAEPHLHFEITISYQLLYDQYKKVDPTQVDTGWVDPDLWIEGGHHETCSHLITR